MQTTTDPTRPPLPRKLQVEVTASCNLSCRMCIVRYRPPLPRSASLPLERFRRLLDQMPDLTDVSLQGIGEPLLAPDIYDMVACASERGIRVGFNTNATLLTRRAAERLIDAGLSWLCISLDGATPETYEFVRDGARWDTVAHNIGGLVALKQERRVTHPELSLVMVLMQRNLHELPAVVERAASWGIPRVFVQGLSHDFSDAPPTAYAAIAAYVEEQSVISLPPSKVEGVYARARTVAEREGIDLRLPQLQERETPIEVSGMQVGCDWPWQGAYVTYTGTLMPCCMVMGDDRIALGNVDNAPFVQLWEGDDFRRFREGLISGNPHPVCRGCSLYRGTF
jgi:radical SAM protein with 4Fe4S-binding SPASM domain